MSELTRRGLFGRLFGAIGAAIVAPWLPKAAPALGLRPDAFELAMRPLVNSPVTLAPYDSRIWLLSGDGVWLMDSATDPPTIERVDAASDASSSNSPLV